jgi:hypothetical protein
LTNKRLTSKKENQEKSSNTIYRVFCSHIIFNE